jgi:hypothetical protein
MCVYVRVCVCVCVSVYVCLGVYVQARVYRCLYVYISVYCGVHPCSRASVDTHTYMLACVFVCIYMYGTHRKHWLVGPTVGHEVGIVKSPLHVPDRFRVCALDIK